MRTRNRAAAAAAVAALALGVSLPASASSGGCAFTNGCATLHGQDAGGTAIAMDAKYQSAKAGTLIIGYPDRPGDGATSFDAVLHYTPGKKVTTYQDTGFTLSPTFTSVPCLTGAPGAVTPTPGPGTLIVLGRTLTVEATSGTVSVTPSSGSILTVTGSGTATVDEQYASDGNSCVAAYNYSVAAGTPTLTSTDKAALTFPTSPGGSTWTFLDSDTSGKFSFTGLPAGVSVSGGSLTADTSTATPGTYTNVGVTYTAADGAVFTATFTLKIDGIKSVSPGAATPYYTFAFAGHGVWSNECVTNVGGSNALQLQTCTLGKDHYQDFYALNSAGVPQGDLLVNGGGTYHIQNFLAAYGSPTSCLVDSSTVDPSIAQSNAFDAAIGGRQLHVTGSCTSHATEFSWGT